MAFEIGDQEISDRITADDQALTVFLEQLDDYQYQIPTFQREVVWDNEDVKRLWDSIYKFYPIGSILIWKTQQELHKHREIGGHEIAQDLDLPEFKYILDGQQRATSLFTSLYGGSIEGRPDFNPKLFVDLTVEDYKEDQSGKSEEDIMRNRFLFNSEINSDKQEEKKNNGLIVPLLKIKNEASQLHKNLSEEGYEEWGEIRNQLRRFKKVLDNYQMSLIKLREIEVREVCQIFERINQEGEDLDIFDIVVAKTYAPPSEDDEGFYLREIIEDFKEDLSESGSEYSNLTNRNFLEMIAILIYREIDDSDVRNITETYLDRIKRSHIEEVLDNSKEAAKKTFHFLQNHMNLLGPKIIPTKYFYPTYVRYFNLVDDPNYDLLKKFFWFYSFHATDNLRNSTNMKNAIRFLEQYVNGEVDQFNRFVIDKEDLRSADYNRRGRISRAILSLFAFNNPKDWGEPGESVLKDVYYNLKDEPNLHHIFPKDFIDKNLEDPRDFKHSMMNIAYLTMKTNQTIENENPVEYIEEIGFENMEKVSSDHYIPRELLEWAREEKLPNQPLETFVEKRVDLIIEDLREKLDGIEFEIIDTKGQD